MTLKTDPLRRLRAAQLSSRQALSSLLRLARPQSLGHPIAARKPAATARVWAGHAGASRLVAPLYLSETMPRKA